MAGMGTRSVRLLLPALGLALLSSSCGSEDSGPEPGPTADALAEGLSSGDLSGVVFDGISPTAADRSYDATVADLGDVTPKVEVVAVKKPADAAATATLSWLWPLGTGWSYQTTAPMKLVDDTWQVAWAPSVVEPSLDDPGTTLSASTVEP
jgi:hypothetical protein